MKRLIHDVLHGGEWQMRAIAAEALTAEAFARFGAVIEAGDDGQAVAINAGTCLKYANLALPDCSMDTGQAAVHIYRVTPLGGPIVIRGFERHACGSQAFMPLSGRPYLVVVAPAGAFRRDQVRVFRAKGTQGIQYGRGVWHHFCLALEAESEFLVIDRLSATPDCAEVFLPPDEQFFIAL